MGRTFKTARPVRFLKRDEVCIKRVSRSPFACGCDIVVVGDYSFLGARCVGSVAGLNDGDVVKIYGDGRICRLWDCTSIHNCLFVTGQCNFRCDMCPQPPSADDPSQHDENLTVLRLLKPRNVSMIGITGGEPTLYPDRLVEYFDIINAKFPTARVEVLTNASVLSNFDLTKRLALAAPYDICYCVSLNGDTADLAESIMHSPGGWDKALLGIMNLAKLQQPVEIRVVITQKNFAHLEDIAYFISRNLPFVSHIAFMGQEITGCAKTNFNDVWVEPENYGDKLEKAVRLLAALDFDVSVYNIPLCLLPDFCHRYAERSISDWKQGYLEVCDQCSKKDGCCGFFTTSGDTIPHGIKPFPEAR